MKSKTKPTTIQCDCGNTFRAIYDYRTGFLKSKKCPSCNYADMVKKAKAKLGVQDKVNKPNRKPNKVNGKKRNGSNNLNTKPKKSRKKRTIDTKLDEAWSKLVKLRAGNKCEYCGKITTLNSHHIYSRAKKSVRWDVENGICLCVNHHVGVYFSPHKTPQDFSEWMIEYKGKDFLKNLKLKSHRTAKYTDFEKDIMLKEMRQEINELTLKLKRGF